MKWEEAELGKELPGKRGQQNSHFAFEEIEIPRSLKIDGALLAFEATRLMDHYWGRIDVMIGAPPEAWTSFIFFARRSLEYWCWSSNLRLAAAA